MVKSICIYPYRCIFIHISFCFVLLVRVFLVDGDYYLCVFVALLITRVTRLEFLTDFTDLFYFFCIFMESVAFETRCKGK